VPHPGEPSRRERPNQQSTQPRARTCGTRGGRDRQQDVCDMAGEAPADRGVTGVRGNLRPPWTSPAPQGQDRVVAAEAERVAEGHVAVGG
jgi:hypothetical protein